MKFKHALYVALLLIFSAGRLLAQATTTITPAHYKAAEEVLLAAGMDKQFDAGIKLTIDQYSKQVPEDKREKFKTVLGTFLAKYATWDNVKDNMIGLYAEAFTEAELKQLAVFYKTPLGKKLIAEEPLLLQKSVQIGQTLIASHQVELQQQLQAAFKDQ